MSTRSIQNQRPRVPIDTESVGRRSLARLGPAPKAAGDRRLNDMLAEHREQTRPQAEPARGSPEDAAASRSALQEATVTPGGKSFLAFAKLKPETPGRPAANAHACAATEWAGYRLLRAGDTDTTNLADRIAKRFGGAVRAALVTVTLAFQATRIEPSVPAHPLPAA